MSGLPGQRSPRPGNQGFVLIVALLLLIVLTLVGTVAMRSTTLDFRMVTNSSLAQRSFEASEAARVIVDSLLDGHTATQGGWPRLPDGKGGTLPLETFAGTAFIALADFVEILPQALNYPPYGSETTTCRLSQRDGVAGDCSRPDLRIYSYPSARRSAPRQPNDIWTDVWITQVGNLNFGPLVAGRSPKLSYRIYHVRAVSYGSGNSQSELTWEFRALESK